MSNYNLTDNVNESFDFSVNGLEYRMRYPLVEELEKVQDMGTAVDTLQAKIKTLKNQNQDSGELSKQLKKQEDELNDWMYNFITPIKEGSPSIQDTMKKMNVKVFQNFQNMFRTEFGI